MIAAVTAATARAWGTSLSVVHRRTSSAIRHASAVFPVSQHARAVATRGEAKAMSSTEGIGGRSRRLASRGNPLDSYELRNCASPSVSMPCQTRVVPS